MPLVSSDLLTFALERAVIWRDQAKSPTTTAGERALCRATMRSMALVWRRERAKQTTR